MNENSKINGLIKVVRTESLAKFFEGAIVKRSDRCGTDKQFVMDMIRSKSDLFLPKSSLLDEDREGYVKSVMFFLEDRTDNLNIPVLVEMTYNVHPYDDISLRLVLKVVQTRYLVEDEKVKNNTDTCNAID